MIQAECQSPQPRQKRANRSYADRPTPGTRDACPADELPGH
jgi:hypothetical protein